MNIYLYTYSILNQWQYKCMARKHLRIKHKANNISPCHIWYYNYYISKGQISKKYRCPYLSTGVFLSLVINLVTPIVVLNFLLKMFYNVYVQYIVQLRVTVWMIDQSMNVFGFIITKCNYYLKVTRCVINISIASQSHHDLGRRSLDVPRSLSAQWCGSQHCSTAPASHGLYQPSAPLMSLQHILALYLTPGYALMMSPPSNNYHSDYSVQCIITTLLYSSW